MDGYLPDIEAVSENVRKMMQTIHGTHTHTRARTVHLQSPLTILYGFSSYVQQLEPAIKLRKSQDALPYRTARLVILHQFGVEKKSLLRRMRRGISREWSGGEASADTCQVESFLIVVKTQSCSKADT